MTAIDVPHAELTAATREYGGEWGLQHTRRLMHLVEEIGAGLEYDREIIALAAYLHDWGGYEAWVQPGVDHAMRSGEVAREWLVGKGIAPEAVERVVECIVHHHGPAGRSVESRLFTDADALELLGAVGVCRLFAMSPRDLQAGVARVQHFREAGKANISTESGRRLAEERIRETDEIMAAFCAETFGMV